MALAVVNADRGSNTGGGGANTIATGGISHTGGNLIIVGIRRDSAASVTTNSVTDTAGNTYTQLVLVDRSGDRIEIWYAKNISGNASNVVTANFSGNCAYRTILVLQVSGADTTAPADATASGTGSAGTVTSGAYTTAQADEILVAFAQVANLTNIWVPDTGWTNAKEDTPDSVSMISYKIVSATQTGITTTVTVVSGAGNSLVIGTFKAAAGGPTTYSATAAATTDGPAAEATATSTPPTFSATAAAAAGGSAAAASATSTPPTFSATCAATAGGAAAAAAATSTPPTFSATCVATTAGPAASADAIFAAAVFTALAASTSGGAASVATATFAAPIFSATCACETGGASASASDQRTVVVYPTILREGYLTKLREGYATVLGEGY